MTIGRRTNYPPPSHGVTTMLDPSGPSSSSIDKLGSSFVTRAGKALRQNTSLTFYFNTLKLFQDLILIQVQSLSCLF